MFGEYLFLLEQINNSLNEIYSHHSDLITCKEGCSHCCYAFFDVSFLEGLYILSNFNKLNKKLREKIVNNAHKSLIALQNQKDTNPDLIRVRCPMLSDSNRCILYQARPINCRIYGVPVSFADVSHVCGKSRFKEGVNYPTIKMDKIQDYLFKISAEKFGLENAKKRFTLCELLVNHRGLIGSLLRIKELSLS